MSSLRTVEADLQAKIAKLPVKLAQAAAIALAAYESGRLSVREAELIILNIELHLSNLCDMHRMEQPTCPAEHARTGGPQ